MPQQHQQVLAQPSLMELSLSRLKTREPLCVKGKVRTKIYSGEFVNFSSLLPKDLTSEDNDIYKSVEREGQLVFVKAKVKDPIKTINKWMEAFHVS